MQLDTLIHNARLHDREGQWSVGILGGEFAFVGQEFEGSAQRMIEAEGKLLLPGLLEPHTHIDKTYTWMGAGQDMSEPEALRRAIAAMQLIKATRQGEAVKAAARRAFDRAISFGVSHLRSHLDLAFPEDLATIRLMVELREEYRNRLHIEFTALGGVETPEQCELMRQAIALGVDCIGGAPALAENPRLSVMRAVELAEELGKPLDLHIDETEDPNSYCLELLANLVIERGFGLPVLASHCCSLAFLDNGARRRILDKVGEAHIHLITLPACNLVLMGRRHDPKPRGGLPVHELIGAGISICAGADNVGDPFHPWGDYDPLRTAALCAKVAHLDEPSAAFNLVSSAVAGALNVGKYGISPGNSADCSLLETTSLSRALAEGPLRSHVFFGGRLVLQQQVRQLWSDS